MILLGATLHRTRASAASRSSASCEGTGSTLTSYVYNNSPAGRGRGAGQGLCRRLRPARDRGPAQLRRRPDRSKGEPNGRTTDASRRCGESSSTAAGRPWPSPEAPVDGAGARGRGGAGRAAPRGEAAHLRRGEDASRGAQRRLRAEARGPPGLALGPPGRGARADRPLGLREDDPASLAQPPCRPDAGRARGAAASRSRASTSTRSRMTDLRRRVGMVFQQPNPFPLSVFDNVAYGLRERGKRRPSRRSLGPAVDGDASAGQPLRGGQGQPLAPGDEPLGRPAAAPVHRPLARRAPARPAARRALLGARPAVHGGDRGPDRATFAPRWRS